MWPVILLLLAGQPCLAIPSRPGDGETRSVTLENLLFMPERYDCKSVRTAGELDVAGERVGGGGVAYTLRGGSGGRLVINATAAAAEEWARHAPSWVGREIEVTGLVSLTRPGTPDGSPPALTDPDTGGPAIYITIWRFFGPSDEKEARLPAGAVALAELTANAAAFAGKTVTTLGRFRGANVFDDLPMASRRRRSDWVIKDGRCAIWVSGKGPNGDGWRLDPKSKGDSIKWLRVTGRVSSARGVVTIRAASVSLARDPSSQSARGE